MGIGELVCPRAIWEICLTSRVPSLFSFMNSKSFCQNGGIWLRSPPEDPPELPERRFPVRVLSILIGRVRFNPPFCARWRVKANPPYAGIASARQSSAGKAGAARLIPAPEKPDAVSDLCTHKKTDLGQARDRRTIREFQFPESTDLHLRVKRRTLSAVERRAT